MAAALANAAGTRFGITYTVTLLDNFEHATIWVQVLLTENVINVFFKTLPNATNLLYRGCVC